MDPIWTSQLSAKHLEIAVSNPGTIASLLASRQPSNHLTSLPSLDPVLSFPLRHELRSPLNHDLPLDSLFDRLRCYRLFRRVPSSLRCIRSIARPSSSLERIGTSVSLKRPSAGVAAMVQEQGT